MSHRRELEQAILKVASRYPWSPDNLDWLKRENAMQFKELADVWLDLMAYLLKSRFVSDMDDDTTVISLDVLDDLLVRINLLKVLLQDKELRKRKDIQSGWPEFRTIYDMVREKLSAIEYVLTMYIQAGIERRKWLDAR